MNWLANHVGVAVDSHWSKLSAPQFQHEVTRLRELCQRSSRSHRKRRALFADIASMTNAALLRSYEKNFYPVQLLAGYVTSFGSIAEMQTGEGKTLVTLLPIVWHALHRRQVHVATTNEYLAQRDYCELKPVLDEIGITAGLTRQQASTKEKQNAYGSDVVFGAGSTFGFDFLQDQTTRQQLAFQRPGLEILGRLRSGMQSRRPVLQPLHNVTIIDEADSILLDEAVTPMVLSDGRFTEAPDDRVYRLACRVATSLVEGTDFVVEHRTRAIRLTSAGWTHIHGTDFGNLYLRRPWSDYVLQSLKARHLFHRNADYVVQDNRVQIVDCHTGRIQPERAWQDGLHQAIECLESVPVSQERRNSARLTRQHFYTLYSHLCGMTGTAHSAADELKSLYNISVVTIPLHRPSQRQAMPTRWFTDMESKYRAIAESVRTLSQAERPVLIGTATIAQSMAIADHLTKNGLQCVVLNGLQDEQEARIVSRAGVSGQITIATNMAGRGTDIRPDENALRHGGLHVIAAQHHESSRVDRQLIGRCARQGEPGSYQFFISAEDELITKNAPDLARRITRNGSNQQECTENFDADVFRIQKLLEAKARYARRMMLDQEHWLDMIRTLVH